MYVDEDTFRGTLATLVALQRAGSLRLLAGGGRWAAPVLFELRRDDPQAEELRTSEHYDEALIDITDVFIALLSDATPEQFVSVRTNPHRWDFDDDEGEVEDAELSLRKFNLVAESFDLADLKRRTWVKATSKTLVPATFEWEVAVKYAEEGEEPFATDGAAVFGTIMLSAIAPRAEYRREGTHALVLTVDREDVASWIDSLTRLRDALGVVEEKRFDE